MNLSTIKELLKEQGVEPDAIDWHSYPKNRDISIQDWLINEYGLFIHGHKEVLEQNKADIEMCKAFYGSQNTAKATTLNTFADFEPEPVKAAQPMQLNAETMQQTAELRFKVMFEPIKVNVSIGKHHNPLFNLSKLNPSRHLMKIVKGIKERMAESQRFIGWDEYISKVLIPNVEVEFQGIGMLKVWR